MKSILFLLLLLSTIIYSCNSMQGEHVANITVTADSLQPMDGTAVFIPLEETGKRSQGEHFPILMRNEDTINCELIQIESLGLPDHFFFLSDLSTSNQVTYKLSWTDKALINKKHVNIRFGARPDSNARIQQVLSDTFYPKQLPWIAGFQRFQTDGPTWENDKVGFRIYLDGRNSIDVFGKIKPAITPMNVGIGADGKPEYNYAEMLDWGTDILAVGNSVGIGGIALKHGDSLQRLGVTDTDTINNVRETVTQVLNNGSMFASLQIDYKDWRPANTTYQARMTIATWPGLYGFRNTIDAKGLQTNDTLLVGLVNSKTDHSLSVMETNGQEPFMILYTHDKQTVDQQNWLGLALLIPKASYAGYLEAPATGNVATSYFVKLKPGNKPVTYYAMACWEKSDAGFANEDYFKKYLVKTAQLLSADVRVSIK